MDKKEFFISWVRRFAVIHGLVMIALYLAGTLTDPARQFGFPLLGKMIIFSFAGTLPGLVYLSKHELSESEWWIRTGIQYVLLLALLLPISHMIGLWKGFTGGLLIAGILTAIDIVVHLLSFGINCFAAADVNRLIQARKQKEQ